MCNARTNEISQTNICKQTVDNLLTSKCNELQCADMACWQACFHNISMKMHMGIQRTWGHMRMNPKVYTAPTKELRTQLYQLLWLS